MFSRELKYRLYVSDSLKVIGRLNIRYADVIAKKKDTDNRTADEIISSIKTKLRKLSED